MEIERIRVYSGLIYVTSRQRDHTLTTHTFCCADHATSFTVTHISAVAACERPLPTARGPRGCTEFSSTACASLCAQPSALQRRHAGVSLPSVRRLHQTRVHRVLHASSSAPKAAAGVGQQPRSLDNLRALSRQSTTPSRSLRPAARQASAAQLSMGATRR